jgi:hypothetical protein
VTAATKRDTPTIKDTGTQELARRFTVVPKLASPNTWTSKVIDETEMDRLLVNDDITSAEYSILVALLKRLRRSFGSLQSPEFTMRIVAKHPSGMADRKARSIYGVVNLIKGMDKVMGSAKRRAMIDLVFVEVRWPYEMPDLKICIGQMQILLSRN